MSYLRVKICGITRAEDACAAVRLGADAIGLNFYAESPRYVDPGTASDLLRRLPPFVEAVGVFVRETASEARAIAERCGRISTIQRHGDDHEPADVHPFRLIDAFRLRDRAGLRLIEQHLEQAASAQRLPDAILIDGSASGQYGGTGQPAPWQLLADFKPPVPLILAGGLTPENVASAVRIVRPYAVDVASGVESSPGRKDVDKIKRFIDNARSAV